MLVILVLVQPVAGATASARMIAHALDAAAVSAPEASLTGHQGSSVVDSVVRFLGEGVRGAERTASPAEMASMGMAGCHEFAGVAADDATAAPGCCTGMNGVSCGMDCGSVSSAVSQLSLIPALPGHGAFVATQPANAPESLLPLLFKPPRTS